MTNKFMFFADSDDEGEKIRKWFKRYLSESEHIYVDKTFVRLLSVLKII